MRWLLSVLLTVATGAACAPTSSARAREAAGLQLEAVLGNPPGSPIHDDDEWHLTMFHVHSVEGPWRYSRRENLDLSANYSAAGARNVLRLARSRGVRVLVLTDHNTINGAFDKELAAYARELGITLVMGNTWSLSGPLAVDVPPGTLFHGGPHISLVGYEASKPTDVIAPADTTVTPTGELLTSVVHETHRRNGAAILQAPLAGFSFELRLDSPLNFDLVEVDGPPRSRPLLARRRWHRWLMDGHRVGAIAAADWHEGHLHEGLFEHLNLVRAPNRSPEAITEALRGGHLQIVSQPHKQPRVLLGADGDGDGDFDDVREGDVLLPAPGAERALFQVKIVGCFDRTLVLYGAASDEPIWRETCDGPESVRAFSIALRPERRTFVRAELWRGGTLEVITNPLYFNPAVPAPPRPDGGPAFPDSADIWNDTIQIIPVTPDGGSAATDGAAP